MGGGGIRILQFLPLQVLHTKSGGKDWHSSSLEYVNARQPLMMHAASQAIAIGHLSESGDLKIQILKRLIMTETISMIIDTKPNKQYIF